LVKEGKIDNTKKTLEAALSQLDNASKNIDSAKSAGMNSNSQEMSDRLTNLVTFTTWFSENYKDTHDLFLQVSEKSSSLLLKL
jgi:ABC-type transporter Mla subunit MlaD